MRVEEQEISDAFLRSVGGSQEFEEAVDIVKANSHGLIWLIGGFVYRSIVEELYGVPITNDVDFDFIVEKPAEKFVLPKSWEVRVNSYGNPKFVGADYEIDLVPLNNVHSIVRRGLEPTIENFLSGAPLTIQAIAFDVNERRVIGDRGIEAIRTRMVGVNNLLQAEHRAELKGKSVEELIKETADSLQFKLIYQP